MLQFDQRYLSMQVAVQPVVGSCMRQQPSSHVFEMDGVCEAWPIGFEDALRLGDFEPGDVLPFYFNSILGVGRRHYVASGYVMVSPEQAAKAVEAGWHLVPPERIQFPTRGLTVIWR